MLLFQKLSRDKDVGTSKTAQQLKACAALAENQRSVSMSMPGGLQLLKTPTPGGPDVSGLTCTHMSISTYIHT